MDSHNPLSEAEAAVTRALEEAQMLREIADASPALLFQLQQGADGNMLVTFASRATEAFFGVKSTDPKADYQTFVRQLFPGDAERIAKGLQNSAGDMQPRDMEFRVHRVGGGPPQWVKAVVKPKRQFDGVLVWNGVMVDISEQKKAEARIEAAEVQLRDVTDNVDGIVFQRRQAPDGHVSFPFLSKGFHRLNPKSEWNDHDSMRDALRTIHPDDRARAEQLVQHSAQTLEPYLIEYRLELADGSFRWMRGSGVPRREADGAITWNGFTVDIHERREAEQRIAEEERRIREMTERLPGVVFQQRLGPDDDHVHFPYVGGALTDRLPGLQALLNNPDALRQSVPEEDLQRMTATMMQSARDLQPYTVEHRLRLSNNETIWLKVEAIPHKSADGAIVWNGFSADITNEKAAQERIHEITAALPGTVYQLQATREGGIRFTYVSGGADNIWGVKADAIVVDAHAINDRIQINDFLTLNRNFIDAAKKKKAVQYDYRYHHPDGRLRWLRTTAMPRQVGNGVTVWNGYTMDVTVEREAQQRLVDVTETMPGAVFQLVMNKQSQLEVSFVSHGVERLIGLSKGEIEKNTAALNLAILEEDRPIMAATLRESLRSNTSGVCDVRVRHLQNGKQLWIRAAASPNLTNPDCITWSGFWWDITDIKELQAELGKARDSAEALHEKLLGVTNNMPGALFEFQLSNDKEVEIPFVSGSIYNLLGVTKEEIERDRMALLNLIPSDAMKAIEGMIHESLQSMQPRNADFQLRHKSTGHLRWIRAAAIPTGIPAIHNVVWRSFWQDITDIKELQLALETSKETAESANRTKSEFLANMSHEIRTPMNAILGLSHLALRADPPPRLKNHLQKIDRASRSLLGVINDILDFSRIEAGKLELEEIAFSLDTVLEDLANLTGPGALEKGLDFSCKADVNVPRELVGDPMRLGQVLLNLVSNAIKFTERGGVRVRTERVRQELGRVELMFAIEDTGIGLSQEQKGRLFTSFSQADASTTRKYGGSGLGLSISRDLVEMMKGSIDVESEPGRGSRFFFTANFGLAKAGTLEKRGNPIAGRLLQGLHILVVDDNEINLDIAREVLESAGAQVATATNGRQAVDAVRTTACDAVVMDINMPVMNGLEATREIRSEKRFTRLPIVAMTASAMAEDRTRCLEAGMNAHVTKPIDVDEMVEVLARLTRGYQSVPVRAAPLSKLPDDLQALAAQLDLVSAVRRVNHNAVLYRKLLRTFAQSNRRWSSEVQAALKEKDSKTIERLAHSLKGAAANLGAQRLAAAASQLEAAAHKGMAGLQKLVPVTELPLRDLLLALAPLDNAQAEKSPVAPTAQTLDPLRLRTLNRLLAHNDAKAADQAHALAQDFPSEPGFAQLEKQAGAYDFEAARITLLKLSARLKIPL